MRNYEMKQMRERYADNAVRHSMVSAVRAQESFMHFNVMVAGYFGQPAFVAAPEAK